MRPWRLIALVALAAAGCDEDLINPMAARQPRVNNYSESEFYDDKLAMREPPAGTVPRERVVLNPGMTTGKVAGAAPARPAGTSGSAAAAGAGPGGSLATENYLTTFPLKVDRQLLASGRKHYDITCATCHGPVGDGDSLVARQMALRPPPSLHLYNDRPPGYIYEVITKGFGMMASYAAELSVQERWAVVAYVRALQISQAVAADSLTPEERAKLMEGP
jgi:mono/diheme cytochrome c family protein